MIGGLAKSCRNRAPMEADQIRCGGQPVRRSHAGRDRHTLLGQSPTTREGSGVVAAETRPIRCDDGLVDTVAAAYGIHFVASRAVLILNVCKLKTRVAAEARFRRAARHNAAQDGFTELSPVRRATSRNAAESTSLRKYAGAVRDDQRGVDVW